MSATTSFAENPWVRLLLGPAMAIVIVGFGIYYNDARQDDRIAANEATLDKLSSVADELPLLRQALERDNELVNVVIEGLKRDVTRSDARLTAYIEAAGERERSLAERVRELERHEHSAQGHR